MKPQAAAAAEAALGKVDILINNAGIIGAYAPTWEYPPSEWRKVIEVDLTAAYLCCRAVVPNMIARHYGRIVNMASVAGKEGNPGSPAYSAAKAGLIGFTKSLGKELATSGVIVNCVTPTVARISSRKFRPRKKFSASLQRCRWAASSKLKKLLRWSHGSPQPTAVSRRGACSTFPVVG
ncbi:MAG: SDR family NAD(P)-dependent oxidoreductase, partial [Pseudorhodoplanes sp.]|nr:SDR family NAD(P)-dependent oxidoreductase [Pseudorhodoplanes sp.]